MLIESNKNVWGKSSLNKKIVWKQNKKLSIDENWIKILSKGKLKSSKKRVF